MSKQGQMLLATGAQPSQAKPSTRPLVCRSLFGEMELPNGYSVNVGWSTMFIAVRISQNAMMPGDFTIYFLGDVVFHKFDQQLRNKQFVEMIGVYLNFNCDERSKTF